MLSLLDLIGMPVVARSGKRIGRVDDVVFAPDEARVVGFVVGRPRLLLLFDRKDRLLAFDSVTIDGGAVRVVGDRDAWDARAARRLRVDWDRCAIWHGMPVRTESGSKLGTVHDALIDDRTGAVERIELSGGVAADIIVGVRAIEARLFREFDGEAIVVADPAAEIGLSGGAAAAAGKGAARLRVHGESVARKAAATARSAAAAGSALARQAARSETGKRVLGWFRAAADGIRDAMSEHDDEA